MTRLILYTTVYPGVERYLSSWYASVRAQTDQDFALWIGLDSLSSTEIEDVMGVAVGDQPITWIAAPPGCTPAQVRQRALQRAVDACDAVILVDSDDVLWPTRVASARAALERAELVACPLRLVDEQGADMRAAFRIQAGMRPEDAFPRHNIFGLSNSAYRCDLLRECLPIPDEAILVDWFLSSRAWLFEVTMEFGAEVQMDYRQHGANTARVLGPFDAEQVARDTSRVLDHFRLLQASPLDGASKPRLAATAEAASDITLFYKRVVPDSDTLTTYVKRLNALEIPPLWWASVAHPSLQSLWVGQWEKI